MCILTYKICCANGVEKKKKKNFSLFYSDFIHLLICCTLIKGKLCRSGSGSYFFGGKIKINTHQDKLYSTEE